MQRTIKFRAWDKKEKSMLYLLEPAYEKGKGAIIMYAPRPIEDGFELMQSTGLKDKNDKEIYEGDVMRVKALGNPENINPVVWDSENSQWSMINWPMTPYSASFSEIIGNIYDNPELLKS